MANEFIEEPDAAAGRRKFWRFVAYLREYGENCSIVGFAYIANRKLHFTERIFWLICVLCALFGVYYLTRVYQDDYRTRAVSIIYENIPPLEPVEFPSLSVCRIAPKVDFGKAFDEYVRSLSKTGDFFEYSRFVNIIVHPNAYSPKLWNDNCKKFANCEECGKCPADNYREIAWNLTLPCSIAFNECRFGDRTFDCCKHFLPLVTPLGICFMLNSLQNNSPDLDTWLPNEVYQNNRTEIFLNLNIAAQINVLGPEDIPTLALPYVGIQIKQGAHKILKIQKEDLTNDDEIRDIAVSARECYFPDEVPAWSAFRSYSFTVCVTDCIRMAQVKACNCSTFNFDPYHIKDQRDCDYEGMVCLEKHSVLKPNIGNIVKFDDPKSRCNCLPSCIEDNTLDIYSYSYESDTDKSANLTVSFVSYPSYQFHRLALRTSLDVVVSIGGILGLFLGASILSAVEFVYFFTIRAANTALRRTNSARKEY